MRDQLVDSQAQSSITATEGRDVDMHGLPSEIYRQVMALPPGIPERLVTLLKDYPAMSEQILDVASPRVGMSTVKKAIEIQNSAPGAGISAKDQAEIREMNGDDVYKKPGAARAASTEASPTEAPAAHKAADAPAWIASAHHYNSAHATLVDEFNELTDNTLALDDVQADPKLIARWQRDHGIAGDGKVGPQTVAAARAKRGNSNAIAKADAPVKGALIDV